MKREMRVLLTLLAAMLVLLGAGCTAKVKKSYHLSRANHYYEASQLQQAEIEYISVLRYDQTNSLAFGRLGLIYYDEGRLQRALFFLTRGSRLAPENLELRLKLGFIYSAMGQYTQAVAQADFVLKNRPQDDEAPILLAEASMLPRDAAAARQRLQAMAQKGDRAAIEVALGNLAMHERDVAAAAAAYKKAQMLDPKSPAVNDALATLAWAQGDLKQAEADFKAAADASPARSPRRMQYVRFKVETGDLEGARTALAEIIKMAPDYLPAKMMLAEIAAAEKKYDESEAWVAKVLEEDPDNFDAMFFEGQLELANGALDKAVPTMERMARLYPQVAQVHYQLGSAYLAANNLPAAAESLKRALELNPNFIEAELLLARIQISGGNAGPAIVALEALRQKQPRLVQAQLLLADAYRLQNRVSDSLQIYSALETMYPTNDQVMLLHGAALLSLGDEGGARTAFDRVLQMSPGNVPAIEQLVDLDLKETNFAAATQLIHSEIEKYPKQMALRLMAAKVQLAQSNTKQAEATLTQVLAADPDNLSAHLLLAQLYSDTGQNVKALAEVDVVMAKDPQNTSALMLAARIYEIGKDYKKAAEAYEKVLKIEPKDSPALNNVAYLYSEYLNNLDRAYELAQLARQVSPFDPSIADTLGWIDYKRGDYQAALGLLQESAAKLPAVPDIQFHLGMANYMNGNEAKARAALQQAWQTSTNFVGRDECGRSLSILDINPATADAAAVATLEKRVSETPNDTVALVRLARIYQREGNTEKAIAAYESLLQAMPKNLEAMVNLTKLYEAKDPKKAYEMAKTASKAAPYDPNVSHTLGRLAFQAGDYQLATSVLQQTVQNEPNDASLQFDYGRAAYSIGKVAVAQAAFQSALALNLAGPQAQEARRILDLMALAAAPAQAAAAQARIGEALKTDPDDVPALMARAAASEYGSDRAGAEQACEKVLAHYPDFIPAQEQLAWLYMAEPARLDRAYQLAANLHETLPDDYRVTKILGMILVRRGEYSHALNLLQQCAMKTSSDADIFYYMGSAQFHLKDKAESKANLQKALALNLSGPPADSAKQMLSELK